MTSGDVRLSELVTAGGCAAKYAAGRLEELLAGSCPPIPTSSSSGSTRPTTPPSTASTTIVRSSSLSTSFPRSSTTPRTSAPSRRRTRSTTCSRWADRRCSRSRSPPSPKSCPPSCSATCFAAQTSACARRGAPRRWAHDPRRRAEVRPRRRRHRAPRRDLGQEHGTARRCALPHEAARHGARAPRAKRGLAATSSSPRRSVDARAERPGCRRRSAFLTERGYGRHRLRAPRPRVRDGVAERSPDPVRCDAAACPCRRPRRRRGRGANGRRRPEPEFAGHAVTIDGVPDEVVALAWDPQTSGGLLVAVPAERGAVLEAAFRDRTCSSRASERRRGRASSWPRSSGVD